jgi:perosamine synthetase
MQTTIAPPNIHAERAQPAQAGFIPLCVPHLEGAEREYVLDCLDSNWLSSVGPYVGRFERALADRLGLAHAVATVNGTAALHVALLACGVLPDDEVLVSTLSFIAPANAVRYCGAWPVFVDVDAAHWQMDVGLVERFLREDCVGSGGVVRNRRTGRRVSAVVPVHILGHPVDIAPLVELARRYGLKIVEDATESLGSLYKEQPVGTHGDAACFSFNGNKLITTGGGGMIVSGDAKIAERAYYLTTQAKDDPVEYVHNEIGFNYRLTNIQAALGCAQLERVDRYIEVKRAIAARYREGLPDGFAAMDEAPWARSTSWLYTVLVDGIDRRELLKQLYALGIQTRPLWQPLHASPAHRGAEAVLSGTAERIHDRALSLPSSVGLTVGDQSRVIDAIHAVLGEAG